MKILQIGKFYPVRGGVEKVMYDITVVTETGPLRYAVCFGRTTATGKSVAE